MLSKPASALLPYILVAAACFIARFYLLSNIGLTDYDSVRNWQVVQEIGQGDYQHLFHHASPGFFLFFAVFTPFFQGVHPFIFLNMLFNVGSVLYLIWFIQNKLKLTGTATYLTGLLFGLSVFAVSTGRNFANESISMLLFLIMLNTYYQRLIKQDTTAFLKTFAWLALALTINYKFLLLLPIALVIEFLQRDGVVNNKALLKAAFILVLPFVLFGFVAVWVEQPFYKLPAVIVSINSFNRPNLAHNVGRFNFDFLYYLRYIFHFEWPFIVPALFLFPILYRKQLFWLKKTAVTLNIYQYLFLVIYLFLAGMHLLLKAPRGLTFIYGLLYVVFYLVLQQLISNRALVVLVLVTAIGYQVWKLETEIYQYAHTSYGQVTNYLKQNNIKKIASTGGRGIIPFATEEGILVRTVLSEEELPVLKQQGYTHVLLDEYYQIANISHFKKLERLPVLAAWHEPTLLAPILFLDHTEFTGLSYLQTLALQKKAAQDSVQLRLLRIP